MPLLVVTFWLAVLESPRAVCCLIHCFVGSHSESHLACKLAGLSVNTVKGDSYCMKPRECTCMLMS